MIPCERFQYHNIIPRDALDTGIWALDDDARRVRNYWLLVDSETNCLRGRGRISEEETTCRFTIGCSY